jgi:hypothetical protein
VIWEIEFPGARMRDLGERRGSNGGKAAARLGG